MDEGSRLQTAVLLAFDQVNNKTDGVYDDLLLGKQARCQCFGHNIFVTSWPQQCSFVHVAIQLKLLVRDSKRLWDVALGEVLQLPKSYVGVITGESSGPTIEMADLLSIPLIDRALISCTATSPALSKLEHSNFVRTTPSDGVVAKMMARLMKGRLDGWDFSRQYSHIPLSITK